MFQQDQRRYSRQQSLAWAKGAAPPSVALRDIYRGIVPIVAIQLLGIALVLILPRLATWLPINLATP